MFPQKGEIYRQSKELKDIIASHNWTLYDVTRYDGKPYTFDELEKKGPANEYIIGHNYIFTPIKKDNQTLREAYSPTNGSGPTLTIDNIEDKKWAYIQINPKANGKLEAMFSRIHFLEKNLAMFAFPKTKQVQEPDLVAVEYENLLRVMKENFSIVLPKPYQVGSLSDILRRYN